MCIKNLIKAVSLTILVSNISIAKAEYTQLLQGPGYQYYSNIPSSNDLVFSYANTDLIGYASTTTTVGNSPLPYVSSSSSLVLNNAYGGLVASESLGRLIYDFNVTGSPKTLLPLNFTSYFAISKSNTLGNDGISDVDFALNSGSSGSFSISCLYESCDYNLGNPYDNSIISFNGDSSPRKSTILQSIDGPHDQYFIQGNITGTLFLLLDDAGKSSGNVQIGAHTRAYGYIDTQNAYIDPYFFIGSSYLSQNPNSSISFTEGVGNAPVFTSPVPEPKTNAMMFAGLFLVGFNLFRNKRNQG